MDLLKKVLWDDTAPMNTNYTAKLHKWQAQESDEWMTGSKSKSKSGRTRQWQRGPSLCNSVKWPMVWLVQGISTRLVQLYYYERGEARWREPKKRSSIPRNAEDTTVMMVLIKLLETTVYLQETIIIIKHSCVLKDINNDLMMTSTTRHNFPLVSWLRTTNTPLFRSTIQCSSAFLIWKQTNKRKTKTSNPRQAASLPSPRTNKAWLQQGSRTQITNDPF